ncbi:hypothetical protein HYPSUDRAFT_762265 [Hypholoma sublateritium FD-334 SS-4]|uniref:Uncharacterized protein n=1 Tax=Hypholoma sublateritium (strain FD-334 SS-4) TaxID=945553 RepID=A0A0D2PMP9_HYPSF|nr:hypothetical protein HYPSUDRAFT_762265 [Hypholoma sublateritium FD-334 SS-4]
MSVPLTDYVASISSTVDLIVLTSLLILLACTASFPTYSRTTRSQGADLLASPLENQTISKRPPNRAVLLLRCSRSRRPRFLPLTTLLCSYYGYSGCD